MEQFQPFLLRDLMAQALMASLGLMRPLHGSLHPSVPLHQIRGQPAEGRTQAVLGHFTGTLDGLYVPIAGVYEPIRIQVIHFRIR